MFNKIVQNLTDEQLKARRGMCLGVIIVYSICMLIFLVLYFTKSASSEMSPSIFIVLGFAIFIIPYGIALDKEYKKRKASSQ